MKSILALTALALAAGSTVVLAQTAPGSASHRGAFMERLKAADTNGDGMLSRDEAGALPRLAAHFDAIDADHNGQITLDELHASMKARHAAFRARAMKAVDTNGDGNVSRDEFLAHAAARFDRLDANKDGTLTPDELRAGHHRHVPRGQ